jgi:hypothetical protein
MADDGEIEDAFERGRRVGQLEGIPFRGIQSLESWLPGAHFEFYSSWFDSFVRYERSLVENLRLVHRMRWLSRRDALETKTGTQPNEPLPWRLREIEEEIKAELLEARLAVDAEIKEGRGRACVVAALRAAPQRPVSVVEYANVAAFVEQDRRRAVRDWPHREAAAGADFGHGWQLENPFRRWDTTRWRISWLCGPNKLIWADDEELYGEEGDVTNEVYANESLDSSERYANDGRVWLLGKIHTRTGLDRALVDLTLYAMRERNSLVAAANAVAEASAKERHRRPDDEV